PCCASPAFRSSSGLCKHLDNFLSAIYLSFRFMLQGRRCESGAVPPLLGRRKPQAQATVPSVVGGWEGAASRQSPNQESCLRLFNRPLREREKGSIIFSLRSVFSRGRRGCR